MKNRQIALLLALLMVLCAVLAGCGNEEQKEADSGAFEPYTFTDSTGQEITIEEEITSVVPSGPLAQMVLFAICPDEFVGIAVEWGEEAKPYIDEAYFDLPVTGQIFGGKGQMNPEEIAASGAQIIIDIGDYKDGIEEDMEDLTMQTGIPAVHINSNLEGMAETYRMLGQLLNKEEEAAVLADYCDEIYGNTQTLMEQVGDDKEDVIYCVGADSLNVIAKDSYHSILMDLMTDNLAVVDNPSSKGTGNEVDMEQLLVWDPDYILFEPGGAYAQAGTDPLWKSLEAVSDGDYFEVPEGPYNWMGNPPSINLYMGMIYLSELLYPEESDYDLFDEAVRYYDLFYHCELTQDMFDQLTENAL